MPPPLESYKLQHIDSDLAHATSAEWIRQADELESSEGIVHASSYRLRANWVTDYANGDAVVDNIYGLVEEGRDHAVSLVELVHSQRIQRLKLLNMYFEPRLDILQPHEPDFIETINVLGASVISSVGLIFKELPSREIKIYGRTDHMHAVLDVFKDIFSGDDNPSPHLEAARQGAWLVFTKSNQE